MAIPWTVSPFLESNLELSTTSPALTASPGSTPIEAFSGTTPFVPSGLTNIPFITDLIGSGSSSVGFHVPGMFINLTKQGDDYKYSNNGVEMIFAQDAEGGKDLEAVGARIETANVADLSERLVSNYGLSTERAQEVAKLSSSYNKLSSKRSLTETEMNKFSQELVGMNYFAAQSAMEKHFQGDSKEYNSLLQKAANKNGVDPEQVSSIMGELLLK